MGRLDPGWYVLKDMLLETDIAVPALVGHLAVFTFGVCYFFSNQPSSLSTRSAFLPLLASPFDCSHAFITGIVSYLLISMLPCVPICLLYSFFLRSNTHPLNLVPIKRLLHSFITHHVVQIHCLRSLSASSRKICIGEDRTLRGRRCRSRLVPLLPG